MAELSASGARGGGLRVEVVCALPQRAIEISLVLPVTATVGDALAAAAAELEFAGVDVAAADVGVFGAVVARDRPLEPADRIEVYRPLAVDPKAARRTRVNEARARRRSADGGRRPGRR
jgi:putative ubiquitin-RnfH superfamily antitoxin RatB of RatAB toxin-antitoxin module